jgi:hypothetical protein
MTQPSGEEVVQIIREETGPQTILSFSRGKDSIGAFIALRDTFEVVPYHLYLVPGLEFVAESLAYYERVFGVKIWNLPHPSLYRWLNCYVFQTPAHAAVIAAAQLPSFDYEDIRRLVREGAGLPEGVYTASGVRAVDSPMRMASMKRHGPINRRAHTYMPVHDWKKARLREELVKSGIKLPVDYLMFGRSFDGLDLRFLVPLKRERPRDYKILLEWFPLAEMEVWRFERYGAKAQPR